jgi:hypothetical protein
MTARYRHADVTISGNMRFCAEYFDRRSEFERRIVVNGVAATGIRFQSLEATALPTSKNCTLRPEHRRDASAFSG